MYILKNSLISITRNKWRNILIGIIILVIACSSTVTLAIRNTANNLVENYKNAHDTIATISFNRKKLQNNFKPGEDSQESNIEAFNSIEQLTIEDITKYGDSNYLKTYYYTYSTSLDSDTLTKASDSFERPQENKNMQISDDKNNQGDSQNEENEKIESKRNFEGDFKLIGYSSYEAMTEFVDGSYTIIEGEMISDFSNYECVISSELASLNEISIGDTVNLKDSNNDKTFDFVVKGIYSDNSDISDTQNMFSGAANQIITGSEVITELIEKDSSLVTNITPSFVLNSSDDIDAFSQELTDKGLNENYAVNTNLNEIESATESIQNVKTFATTFLIITFIISAVVLFVINMINIRERKYEIGVFRTIGISKFKLTMQFVLELLIVSIIALAIGAVIGTFLAKPVGNMLLKNEIESTKTATQQISDNFGGRGPGEDMRINGRVSVQEIQSMDTVVNVKVVLELLGIGLLLTSASSFASMISIQRFSPLDILKERS